MTKLTTHVLDIYSGKPGIGAIIIIGDNFYEIIKVNKNIEIKLVDREILLIEQLSKSMDRELCNSVNARLLSLNNNIYNQTINLSSGEPTSVKKLLNAIRLLIPGTEIIKTTSTRGDQYRAVGNSKKLNKIFKHKFTSLRTGLSKFLKSI